MRRSSLGWACAAADKSLNFVRRKHTTHVVASHPGRLWRRVSGIEHVRKQGQEVLANRFWILARAQSQFDENQSPVPLIDEHHLGGARRRIVFRADR